MLTTSPAWDDGDWPGLPGLDHDVSAHVCVVGLGGSGLSCIDELLSMGRRVVGIDAIDVAAGAAGRNGGLLLPGTADYHHDAVRQLGRDRALRVHQLTLEETARIDAQAPGVVRYPGSLRLADSPDEERDCELQLASMREDGLPVEPYEGPFGRGLFFPGDAVFNPVHRCRALARRLMDRGAKLFGGAAVQELAHGSVRTASAQVHCEAIIIAVDGRLDMLLPELSDRVRTARLQMLATAPAPDVSIPYPMSLRWGFDYWQQTADGRILLGGGRDGALNDEWTSSDEPTAMVQQHLEHILRDRLGVRATVTHRWAASVGYTTNGLPVMTEVRPRIWAIGGYCGTGNLIGALCGRAVAHLASGESSEFASLITNPSPQGTSHG